MNISRQTNGFHREEMFEEDIKPARKDSVTKEHEKIDELRRNESDFIQQLRRSVAKTTPNNGKMTADERMKQLVEQADKYANFLLTKHRMQVSNIEKADIRTTKCGKRRMSDQLDPEETNFMEYHHFIQ